VGQHLIGRIYQRKSTRGEKNAVLVTFRCERISKSRACDILRAVSELSIPVVEHPEPEEIFKIAAKYHISAYDATHAVLATKSSILITGDMKLYESLKGEKQVMLIGAYK